MITTMSEKEVEKIIKDNGRIITHVISSLTVAPHIEYKDLFQIGQIAIFESLKTYREGAGKKFSSYAYSAVRGKILNYLKDNALSFGRPRGKLERLKPDERSQFIYENKPVSLEHRELVDDRSNFEEEIISKVCLEQSLTAQQQTHYKLLAEGFPYRTIAKILKYSPKHEIFLREKLLKKLKRLEGIREQTKVQV